MDLYFLILNFVFRVISTFSKKNAVPQVNDKLLFVSAKRAAEKIRRKEVNFF
jgi:hypothetical protein